MIKSSTQVQRLTFFHHIKDRIPTNLRPGQSSKPASKAAAVPIISHKRQQAKHKVMFSNNMQRDMAESQLADSKTHQMYINKLSNEEEDQKNAYLLQAIRNENYLKKKRSTQKGIKNEGFSIYNPNRSNWRVQQKDQESNGLDKFTNIIIKKLQRKSKKVSFSQFLQDKKQQDYLRKFKYTPQKQKIQLDKSKDDNFPNIEKIKLNSLLTQNQHLRHSQSHIKKQSQSVVLNQSRKKSVKSRVYTKMGHERYHSITGLNEGFGGNTSLEISQIKVSQ